MNLAATPSGGYRICIADPRLAEHHAAQSFDAPSEEEYVFIRLKPEAIQACRTAPELANRTFMRNGPWLA